MYTIAAFAHRIQNKFEGEGAMDRCHLGEKILTD
jgi:hypothetical protein